MDRQRQAYLYAAATILLWSTVAAAFKLTLRHLQPAELLLYASLTSLAVLAALLIAAGRLGDYRTWSRGDVLRSAGLGFLNPFLYYLLLFAAYDRLPAQEAQPLNFTWPIVLVLLSAVILGQRLRPASLAAMAVSFGGVLVIATRGEVLALRVTDGLGVTLALASTVIWAGYWLYGVRDDRDPLARLALNFAFGSGFVALYAVIFTDLRPPPAAGLLGAAYVGLFEMGITFVLWLKALKLSRSTAQVGNLIYLTPFLSLLVIHAVVGEPLYPSTLLGLTLIVAGILMQHYGEKLTGRAARSIRR